MGNPRQRRTGSGRAERDIEVANCSFCEHQTTPAPTPADCLAVCGRLSAGGAERLRGSSNAGSLPPARPDSLRGGLGATWRIDNVPGVDLRSPELVVLPFILTPSNPVITSGGNRDGPGNDQGFLAERGLSSTQFGIGPAELDGGGRPCRDSGVEEFSRWLLL